MCIRDSSSSDTPKLAGAGVTPSDKNPPLLDPSAINGSSIARKTSFLKDALINDNISLESRAFSAMALWCYYDNIKEYEIGVNYLKISKSSINVSKTTRSFLVCVDCPAIFA